MARISKPPQERRQELIEAARELFISQGYEKTMVGDIVRRVGVAQGLFYYYFRSKQEIFLEVINQYLEERIDSLVLFLRDSQVEPMERVRNLMRTLMDFLREIDTLYPQDRQGIQGEMSAMMYNHVTASIEPLINDLLSEWAQEGLISVPYPNRLGRFITSGFTGIQNMADPPKADEMMSFILFVLERLLSIPKQSLSADE